MIAQSTAHPARPFTYADLEDTPEDGYRYEIIGGSLIVTPAPSGRHQRAVDALLVVLRQAETPDTVVVSAPYDWLLPDGGSVQPDLLVVSRSDFNRDGPLQASVVPLLVVEVLSPSNALQDTAVKRALYERLGVHSYWIVDPDIPALLALRLVQGRYHTAIEVSGLGDVVAASPFPVRFALADLVR